MNVYTIVLLYPDYLTGDYGADLYVNAASARELDRAVRAVRIRAARAQRPNRIDPCDFRCILAMRGKVEIVADATSF